MLEETTGKCSEKDITILLGDMNTKVGNEQTGYEQVMGKHGLGTMNETWRTISQLLSKLQPGYWWNNISTQKCLLST